MKPVFAGLVLATFVSFTFFVSYTHAQFGQGQGQGQGFGQGQGQGFSQGQGFGQGQGSGQGGQGFGQGQGQGFGDAVGILTKALYCFDEKNIYSSCTEGYRLTEKGELNVPPEDTDNFCEGPCQEETGLVLDCIQGVMQNFQFYNRATTEEVRETLSSGCSYGATRGDFDVAKYIKDDEGSAGLTADVPVLSWMLAIFIGWILLF